MYSGLSDNLSVRYFKVYRKPEVRRNMFFISY